MQLESSMGVIGNECMLWWIVPPLDIPQLSERLLSVHGIPGVRQDGILRILWVSFDECPSMGIEETHDGFWRLHAVSDCLMR